MSEPSRAPARDLSRWRVALVHDWLTGMRGGERVLEVFCELFPHADLYTLVAQPERMSPPIARMRIHPSFLQKLPLGVKHYRFLLPLYPLAITRFQLAGYDLVLSSSHAVAKGVPIAPDTLHVCYLHAPMRYMWDGFPDYFGPGKARWPVRLAAHAVRGAMQAWDVRSSRGVHRFLVNSRHVQEQAQRWYGRGSTVVHPPVDLARFRNDVPRPSRESFYLMVGAFAPNKRVDQAILAFNRLGLPLTIVGSGPGEARCRALAGPTVTFLGEQDDGAIAALYRRARAFVFPGVDDFGITPLEAQACGTPVIANAAGGALETVTPQTGILYPGPGAEALAQAVRQFEAEPRRFRPEDCQANVARFGRERFRAQITAALLETMACSASGGVGAVRERWG
jgi:glycosyltransferase involved in cell wall biosynthesis